MNLRICILVVRGPDGARRSPAAPKQPTELVSTLAFEAPFPERATFRLELPATLRDGDGRPLANAERFPLAVRTDEFPPLAKFAARFGIIEKADPVLPVTLRNVEPEVHARLLRLAPAMRPGFFGRLIGRVARVPAERPADMARWLRTLGDTRRASFSRHTSPAAFCARATPPPSAPSSTPVCSGSPSIPSTASSSPHGPSACRTEQCSWRTMRPARCSPTWAAAARSPAPRRWTGRRARRQAGSTLKPFLYALALDRRLLTAASLLSDTPLEIQVAGGLYRPENYHGLFRGRVTARTALASSLNVPAVRTLGLVGEEDFAAQLRRLGFAGTVEAGSWYGPALALGSADVSPWELVAAYPSLAAGGIWQPLTLVTVETGGEPQRVYSEAAAFVVADMLSDRESRATIFGLENPLTTRFWSAVKTGTGKDMRDTWCVGFSRRYTVGVWVGNFSGAPMEDVSGTTGAAPVWLEVIAWLHRDRPSPPPEPPAGIVPREVSFEDDLEPPRREWFLAGTEPSRATEAVARAQPRIVNPSVGTIVALDPDMPAALVDARGQSLDRVQFVVRARAAPRRPAAVGLRN